ncbi:S9 family peptidase [Paraferrimonas sp. SM1919]|uniref:S9 family peptidase n=1 Tax=Paraferrimonas sp. SM1919 TaxID=2662263 RepID=UPI0013D11309|nr:S9 family peptidase [Paraferrimonas sp. SM1919]
MSLSLRPLSALAVATGLLSSVVVASEKQNVISAEEIVALKQVSSAQVSPDGDHVAFTRSVPRTIYKDKNGVSYNELHIVDTKGNERAYITGNVNVAAIQWSADGQNLYFLAKMGDDKFNALYQIPFNGGEAQKLLSLKDTNIAKYTLTADNKQVALIAKPAKDKSDKTLAELGFMAEVYEEGLTNQQLYVVDLKKVNEPLSPKAWDIEGFVSDVNFGPKGKNILIKTQPTALIDDNLMNSKWHLVDANSQKLKHTYATEGKVTTAEFSYNGEYVAIIGAEDKHDPATGRLYLGTTKSGKIKPWIPNDWQGHISDIEWANDGNQLYLVANQGTVSEIAVIEPSQSDYQVVVKAGEFIAANLSISDSDKTIIATGNTAKHPNEVFMIRGSKHSKLTTSNDWLANKAFAKQQTIAIKARDGVEIDGILIYPLNYKKGQRYPLIMTVHGGPESHDKDGWLTAYSKAGQIAAANGYAVFYPNYRGSTGKGVAYSKLGQGDYAGAEFDDLVDFKQHLVAIGLVDSNKVGITGGSYGGYASAWGATKLTEHFAAAVMFVGISNQLSKYGTTDISNEMNLVHARSFPWEKWLWYLERSPIYWVKQSKTPLLIMHGKADPRVHPAQSMEMYRYMKTQGKKVRLVYYPGEGHGNRKAAAQYDYHLRLMRWMDYYLKQDGKEMPAFELDHKQKLEASK